MTTDRTSIARAQVRYLLSEVAWLTLELAAARLQSANHLAAIRAALSAAADEESDPLAYLRDELAEETGTAGIYRSGQC